MRFWDLLIVVRLVPRYWKKVQVVVSVLGLFWMHCENYGEFTWCVCLYLYVCFLFFLLGFPLSFLHVFVFCFCNKLSLCFKRSLNDIKCDFSNFD